LEETRLTRIVDLLARLDVPPALVAALAAFAVGYVLYELLIRRRIAASQAEKRLRALLSDEDGDDAWAELPDDSVVGAQTLTIIID